MVFRTLESSTSPDLLGVFMIIKIGTSFRNWQNFFKSGGVPLFFGGTFL